MQKPKVEVIPVILGTKLLMSVTVDGKEAFEGEIEISKLIEYFVEFCDPTKPDQEAEAYNLIDTLEEGVNAINQLLSE